ncbi:MAG: ATP-binding protein [Phycisphaerae bacterium]|nr:ATP-binding protein [Phycisphaerae bacterium]
MVTNIFPNPFRPGAGHMPPYLAGRDKEIQDFEDLLVQEVIVNNLILTGLRGVGKTVLLDTFRPLAIDSKWLWAGTDLSESVSISEEKVVIRLLTDLSALTSSFVISSKEQIPFGFNTSSHIINHYLDYDTLTHLYESIPGLVSDKLKALLELVWHCIRDEGFSGIVFAYDEAQTMSDHAEKEQYPLSLLLDVFQSVQRKDIPFMLVLTGLPTLFPKLVEARTFTERMFRVMFLDRLEESDIKEAILCPIQKAECPVRFTDNAISEIIKSSGGYPYFIQFICKESFDMYLQQIKVSGETHIDYRKAIEDITRKLDNDFFAGRWAKVTDRQRELLQVIANLSNSDEEFSVQEVVAAAKSLPKPFSSSHVNQMLSTLTNAGLVYKNRHGRYSFAVPLLGQYIRRQQKEIIKRKGQLDLFPKQ